MKVSNSRERYSEIEAIIEFLAIIMQKYDFQEAKYEIYYLKKEYFCFMETRLKQFVTAYDLIKDHQTTILAVSGGVDSVVMAYLFYQLKLPFEIAHCNFSLRGEASDKDEEFVRALARKFDVKVHVKKFDTEQFASKNKVSIQMAARDLRYAWFDELLSTSERNRIATAHHQGDMIETMLFNLTKGTGISGLHGMQPLSTKIIRPILFLNRDEIITYANENSIDWREDDSNASVKYARNLIRHEVVPVLKRLNPSLEKAFAKSAKRIKSSEDFMHHQIKLLRGELVAFQNEHIVINRSRLVQLPGAEVVLHELIKEFGFNYDQSCDIISISPDESGALFYSLNHVLNVDRDNYLISSVSIDDVSIKIVESDREVAVMGRNFDIEEVGAEDLTITSSVEIAYLDKNALEFPLTLRTWQAGDYFYPLGLGGKKKLSDFMIDSKIALNLKRSVLVLVSGDQIAWVVGHRIDERYKVQDSTELIYKVVVREV